MKRHSHILFLLFVGLAALREAGCGYWITSPTPVGSQSQGVNVTVVPSSATLPPNGSLVMSASVSGWQHDSTVQWTLLTTNIGSLTTNRMSATYNAPPSLNQSTIIVTVRVRSNEDTSRYADATITISRQGQLQILLSPLALTLPVGQTQQFSAIVTGNANTAILWKMVSGLGSISNSGLYSAPASISGTSQQAVIQATSAADTATWARATITIVPPDTTPCFQRDVLPIIVSNCTMSGCHSAGGNGELGDLSTYAGIMRYVRAGNAGSSKLYQVINGSGDDQMPPYGRTPLTADQIALIARWINDGATNAACPTDSTNCDTTGVQYSTFVRTVIQNNCLGCHSGSNPSGSINLSSYSGVQQVAADGRLVGGLLGTPPNALMPQAGTPLDACTIAKIRAWVNQGAPNN